ncbi:MAG TPA: DinB family protein [Ornithinibacter sp.]|nr:DinB family protein [Ornithinibacter sp.]
MISVDEYLGCCDRALDAYAAVVTALGDDLVNARLADVPGSNSAFALVTHIAGMAARWGRTVNRGLLVPRDREAEFTATGTVKEALALVERTRARLHEDVRAASPREQPADPAREQDGTLSSSTQGDVLLHVYEELAQHLGQLEVTRDVLFARRSGGA